MKRGGKIAEEIVVDINNGINEFKKKGYHLSSKKIDKLLVNIDYSIEKKKKELMDELYSATIKTFAVNPGKISKEELIAGLKNNITIIRNVAHKVNDLNHYLSTTFLEDTKIAKKKIFKFIKTDALSRKKVDKLEKTTCQLIDKIIILDNKLLKRLGSKENKIIKEEKKDIKNIDLILKDQIEMIYHLEAKLPPVDKIDIHLVKRPHFDYWIATVLALISNIKEDYEKEIMIFKELKEDAHLRKKIDTKIKHLMKEKSETLKLKEGRVVMSTELERMDENWKRHIHNWLAASEL